MAATGGNKGKENIYSFKDKETTPDPLFEYTAGLRDNRVPLIIDNGGHSCRVGWMTDYKPRMIFRNLIAKSRAKKDGESGGLSIGNDIGNLEMVRWSLRTQFDRDVVTHYDAQEQVFDHIFSRIGINMTGSINHPIILTEPVCNPNYCRQMMSELLFECYSVPQVVYGIDSLFSLYQNSTHEEVNALVVSSSYQVTHILPVLNGRLQSTCRRINVGGAHAAGFLQRLLQLKHPNHSAQITLSRAQELLHEHTGIAVDYAEEMEKWADLDYYDQNVHKIQLPFSQVPSSTQGNGTKSEEKEKLRKQKQGRRLQEINMRRREEKIAEEESRLQQLNELQELEDQDEDLFKSSLAEAGFHSAESLQVAISNLSESLQKRKEKLAIMQQQLYNPEESKEKKPVAEDESDTSKRRLPKLEDEDAQGKRLKGEKSLEKDKQTTGQKNQEQLQQYISSLHKRRQAIMSSRQQRNNRKQELTKRRSHASIERMRILSQLAHDPNSRDSGSSRVSYKKPKEDTFGMNDEDWLIYREINKEAGDSDSEKEQEELNEIESFLKKYDSNFTKQEDSGGPLDPAAYYQLHVGLESVRVPEILYQPSLLGLEQAGISETVQYILDRYTSQEQNVLVQNVFCTGGNTIYQHFQSRLERELLSIRPFQSLFKVTSAGDPLLDAWLGARKWTTDHHDRLDAVSVSKTDYEEMGGEYLKEHFASNRFIPGLVNTRQ